MISACWLFLTVFWAVPAHDFHVSKAQVDIETTSREVQITLHIFLDDLEDALAKRGHEKLFLCTEKEKASAEEHLLVYLKDQFELRAGGLDLKFDLIGKEMSDDLTAVWCYLLVSQTPDIKQVFVRNEILMDLYDDQKNLINVRLNGDSKDFYMLQKGDATRSVRLE